jgi:hypothetical protein
LAVGALSALMARFSKTPVAVIAFAGAVTMIPGVSLYRALASALQLARSPGATVPDLAAATLGHTMQAFLVIGALALGLILGTRAVLALVGDPDVSKRPRNDNECKEHSEPSTADCDGAVVHSKRFETRHVTREEPVNQSGERF